MVDTAAGKMEMHLYTVDLGDLGGFGVVVTDVSQFGELPARDLLQASKNGSVAEVKGTLVAEKEISLDGAPGLEYEVAAADHHSMSHCYYVQGRVMVLVSIAKTGSPFHSDTARFFGSLRFLKPPK